MLHVEYLIIPSLGELLNEVWKIHSHRHHRGRKEGHPAFRVFSCWVDELRRRFTPLPAGTTHSVFRLLFPEEDVQRKYGMQEKLLCAHLAQCTSVPIEELRYWDVEGSSGCLGQELQKALLTRSSTVIPALCIALFSLTICLGRPEHRMSTVYI